MKTPLEVIAEIIAIRYATIFETPKASDQAGLIVMRALDEAGYEVVKKETK